jgi:hypothetical protein
MPFDQATRMLLRWWTNIFQHLPGLVNVYITNWKAPPCYWWFNQQFLWKIGKSSFLMRKFTINDRFLYVYQHLPTIVPGCSRFPQKVLPLFGIALKPTRLPHRPLWISSNPPPQRLRLFWRESKKILDSNLKECNLKSSELNTSQNPGLKKISAKRLVFVICLLRSMTCPASLHQMQR